MEDPSKISRSDWEAAVDGIVNEAHASRAVHRPILVLFLLARARAGKPSAVTFSEIDRGIQPFLQELGRAKKAEPLLPFWHLQTSPFWTVIGGDDLERRKGKDRPTRSALLAANAVGVVRDEWWRSLVEVPTLVEDLTLRILRGCWPDATDRARVAGLFGLTH